MGTAERKAREKKRKMEEITDAAEMVFRNRGIEGATMDDIAETAEFSKRTVYSYFQGKEELLLAVGCRGYKVLNRMLAESVDDPVVHSKEPLEGAEKVMRIGRVFLRFSRECPLYFQIISKYRNRRSDLALESGIVRENYTLGEISFRMTAEAIEEGKADGSIDKEVDSLPAVVFLWSTIVGLGNLLSKKKVYIEQFQSIPEQRVVDEALRLIRKSITPEV